MNDDNERVEKALDDAGISYDTCARQRMKQLAKEVREDERSECERIARENESMRTVEQIGRRRYGER